MSSCKVLVLSGELNLPPCQHHHLPLLHMLQMTLPYLCLWTTPLWACTMYMASHYSSSKTMSPLFIYWTGQVYLLLTGIGNSLWSVSPGSGSPTPAVALWCCSIWWRRWSGGPSKKLRENFWMAVDWKTSPSHNVMDSTVCIWFT